MVLDTMSTTTDIPTLHSQTTETESTIDPESVLQVFEDEYSQELLNLLGDDPLSCREIANQSDMSRPTVYRRINKLKDAGMLDETTRVDSEGHHKSQYTLRDITLSVSFCDGVEVDLVDTNLN